MILQSLYEYADRKKTELPEYGFETVPINFLIVIREDGSFADLLSTEQKNEKGKMQAHAYESLPMRVHRTGKTQVASLLFDNAQYVLLDKKKRDAFIERIEKLPDEVKDEKAIKAVISFYRENKANGFEKVSAAALWKDFEQSKGYVSFKLEGGDKIVPQYECVKKYWRAETQKLIDGTESKDAKTSVCLITGEKSVIARLHSLVTIASGNPTGSSLVSFQKNSGYDSYGKEQAYNAPVSVKGEFAYTKALKYLLKSKSNSVRIGGDTIIFWAEKENKEYNLETAFSIFFSDYDNPDRNVSEIKNLFTAIYTGKFETIDSNFYALGLAPNAARISVRFFEREKVSVFANRIKQHFDDFEIIHSANEPDYVSLYKIISALALENKTENAPPNLAGQTVHAVLKALPYPVALQQQCIRRIRAERKVTRVRAAILKAYINRHNRYNKIDKEVKVSLDKSNTNSGYVLGRLFAVLEKVQQETHPNLNATITDRFYGAASTNPVAVFSQLLKLHNHHSASYENLGLKAVREKEVGEIMNLIQAENGFPTHLSLNDQSMFALGYYHEKENFYKTVNKTEGEKDE